MKLFHTLDEVYNLVCQEESQQTFQLQMQPFTEASAMVVLVHTRKREMITNLT